MIILQDTLNDTLYNRLPRTYGVNDIPLVIQEKGFIFNGGKATAINDGTVSGGGQPTNGVFTLVNGVVYGYVKVPRQVIRLRFLNGSARKTFYLGFSDTLAKPQSASFITNGKLIATDGGYTSKPISVDSFLMAPGERMEILLNLTGRAAKDSIFYLSNLVRSMPRDIISGTGNGNQTPSNAIASTPGNAFIKFIIDTTIQPANPVLTMPTFNTNYTVNPSNVRRQRTKNLILSTIGGNNVWTIDGQPMNMSVINDTVFINTKEIWTINNTTTVSHPFHIHKVQFQVMSVTDSNNVTTVPNDTNNLRYLRGFKDDVLIRSKSSYKLLMSFEDSFDMMIDTMNSFMYHCHILPHEDNSMMHQFVVIDSMLMYMGILHIDKDARFAVYPNPAATELRVKGSSANPITIRFIDLMGRVIREDRLDAFEHTSQTLPLADLPRGMVLMEITTKGKTEVKKILLH
jgi:FtsP/CotA-like multicopper oxidase with cupredoxin domain